jgi:hypothetical protein
MSGFRVPRSGTPTFVGVPVTGDIYIDEVIV